ncbi:putative mitochondrial hypothetical protein [Leptomonas pyrrhocoris]|uniref:Uncharacterized protein n=1 Tax=Leptomonas pyrrhocoris TaxID=157538 RepID=A0A0M9G011_LEPPY|nr:putative mitochondrial hypothetical protein [Leptomonas pyrrhocoris]KPA79463.1 putative mitochondrial hypothetical protein [Leptomonas pyrrhocoris]|eukprot:XP_015657902.1 putative mitochondrial hypothetical protein [Leptomonas pyrrhocoris]
MRRLQRVPLRVCALALSRRTVISGQMPTEGSGAGGTSQGWEMRRGHHLQSSVGLHSPIHTACGRDFNPQVYYEVLQACCDQQWLVAIQRELRTDTEYINYLRQNGGAAKDLRMLTDSVQHDDEFMVKLKEKLKTDDKLSLTLCAVQDSYERIRKKRDHHETQVAADGGRDPYASMKMKQKGEFGSQMPQF